MKKTILALAFAVGLTSFAGNAKAQQSTIMNSFSSTSSFWLGFDGSNLTLNTDLSNQGWTVGIVNSMFKLIAFGSGSTTTLWNTGSPLTYNQSIDSSGTYQAFWNHSINSSFTYQYYGIKYDLGGGNYDYGWTEFSYDTTSGQATLIAAAINTTPNQAINAGVITVVPEPTTYALFGLGALALLFGVRRGFPV